MSSIVTLILAIISLLVAAVALVTALSARTAATQAQGKRVPQSRVVRRDPHGLTPWVIYNGGKISDISQLRTLVDVQAAEAGWNEPHYVSTTVEYPGTKQALEAVKDGAGMVVAVGGDGTIRNVAAGLAHSGVPLGIIPYGTGNLLARNLGIPFEDAGEAVTVAFTGNTELIDICWVRPGGQLEGEPAADFVLQDSADPQIADEGEHCCLVMAGIGFDADVMEKTDTVLKQKIGWFAYVLAGLSQAYKPKMEATLQIGKNGAKNDFPASTVLFANCGTLTGGINLFPHARPDDGWMDVSRIASQLGLVGYLELGIRLLVQGLGIRPRIPTFNVDFDTRRARYASIETTVPRHVEVDGDSLGEASRLDVRLDHLALQVRTP
ncbi:MAG: diacylglycerol kinase family protein [Actinomycetaceae bacterium]|nr:diacylglycerol kinase family protein [Actinomycetaceae bacterium]